MDFHTDTGLSTMVILLVVLLWAAAWTWIRFARQPEKQRENAAYAMAAVLGYSGLVVAYLWLIYF